LLNLEDGGIHAVQRLELGGRKHATRHKEAIPRMAPPEGDCVQDSFTIFTIQDLVYTIEED
jgi:hypothetical protein